VPNWFNKNPGLSAKPSAITVYQLPLEVGQPPEMPIVAFKGIIGFAYREECEYQNYPDNVNHPQIKAVSL
jgi:hypothetical protein